MTEIKRTVTYLPPKDLKFLREESFSDTFLHDIEVSRRIIDVPEYFYQQPMSQQEAKFKEDYYILWRRLDRANNIRIPQTITTYFGKAEFIQDEIHFRDLRNRYKSSPYNHMKDYSSQFEKLCKERKKAFEKLNSLSLKEIQDLCNKSANTLLQIIDLSTGQLLPFPS